MKNIYKTLLYSSLFLTLSVGFTSCEDYLDKEADSTVSEVEAFKNFTNFQGFIEEIYNCIPDKEKCNWCPSWNWGDDEVFNTSGNNRMTHQVDLGNFRAWKTTGNWLWKSGSDPTSTYRRDGGDAKFKHSLWPHAWYCIRKANLGIENLDRLTEATQEERDLIEGQLYFFRAWWHFEMMQYWGGLPYIDKVLPSSGTLTEARLSYQECADKAGSDLRRAADLLPIDWDNTTVGKKTLGQNQLRVNKIAALGYLGKNYLWAASPLMEHGAQLGGGMTYSYNQDYAQKAADALGELLELVESGQTQYALAEYNYEDIYNHKRSSDATTCFSDLFYTYRQNWLMPGTCEAIFRGPSEDFNGSNWNTTKVFGPKIDGLVDHDNLIHHPSAGYVNNYGMANGLPIDDPQSGFDPEYPFRDRDPRFYHDIVFDGFKYVNGSIPDASKEYLRYCSLYTGGVMKSATNGSRTGYYIQKLVPHTCNKYDLAYDWGNSLHTYLPYMRLGDIYLMYAEACGAMGGANAKSSKFGKSGVEAINTLRERVGAGEVHSSYTGDKNSFLKEVRRERAVELSFEGFRFNDLQRWLLLTEYPYNVKTTHEFIREESDDYFKTEGNDPRNARVSGFREEVIIKRTFGSKHYWFPLPDEDVYLYEGFPQNPGW